MRGLLHWFRRLWRGLRRPAPMDASAWQAITRDVPQWERFDARSPDQANTGLGLSHRPPDTASHPVREAQRWPAPIAFVRKAQAPDARAVEVAQIRGAPQAGRVDRARDTEPAVAQTVRMGRPPDVPAARWSANPAPAASAHRPAGVTQAMGRWADLPEAGGGSAAAKVRWKD